MPDVRHTAAVLWSKETALLSTHKQRLCNGRGTAACNQSCWYPVVVWWHAILVAAEPTIVTSSVAIGGRRLLFIEEVLAGARRMAAVQNRALQCCDGTEVA